MVKTTLPRDLTIGSISTGTLRPEDLIPRFLDVLVQLNPEAAVGIAKKNKDVIELEYGAKLNADIKTDRDAMAVFHEDLALMMEELWEAIDENMPKGYYFGTTEGDGADFGIWAVPVDLDA